MFTVQVGAVQRGGHGFVPGRAGLEGAEEWAGHDGVASRGPGVQRGLGPGQDAGAGRGLVGRHGHRLQVTSSRAAKGLHEL